jgi:hypothetical protein
MLDAIRHWLQVDDPLKNFETLELVAAQHQFDFTWCCMEKGSVFPAAARMRCTIFS